MSEEIVRIDSISQLHEGLGFQAPTNPLISIIDVSKWEIGSEHVGIKYSSSLYSIALKDKSCGIQYGRHTYDFNEGVLVFTAPNQVVQGTQEQALGAVNGWMLFFHPDLIRNTHLGKIIEEYGFFSYDVHEALHLSSEEEQTINTTLKNIEDETKARIDNHSQHVIVSNLELLLNYCLRFYERQFNTRTASHKDILSKVNLALKDYHQSNRIKEEGIPSIQYIADHVNLSPSYLSDLLKKETGRTAKDHINDFIIEKAKDLLLSSSQTVSEIAFELGFNYPHYFSRLFKSKTGQSPNQYRIQLN